MKTARIVFCLLIAVGLIAPMASGSETGREWVQTPQPWTTPWSARGTHTSVVFKDRLWILGGHPHGRCSNDELSIDLGSGRRSAYPD